MEFSEVIRTRYSVRSYQQREVSDEVLQRILEAFMLAPTAANRQAVGLVVVHSKGRQQELARIYKADWFCNQAPILICACVTPSKAWRRSDGKVYSDVDVAIAMDHLILAATAEGLGTCWVAAFDVAAAHDVLGLPNEVEPVAFTPLGYAADTTTPRLRKKLEQLVHYDRW